MGREQHLLDQHVEWTYCSSTQPSYLYVNFNVSDQGMEQDFSESKVQMKDAIIMYTLHKLVKQHCELLYEWVVLKASLTMNCMLT